MQGLATGYSFNSKLCIGSSSNMCTGALFPSFRIFPILELGLFTTSSETMKECVPMKIQSLGETNTPRSKQQTERGRANETCLTFSLEGALKHYHSFLWLHRNENHDPVSFWNWNDEKLKVAGDSDLNNNITPSVEILIQLVLVQRLRDFNSRIPKNPNLGFKIKIQE